MTKSTVKHFQVRPACENNQINSDMFNSSKQHWHKDAKDFASEMQGDDKKNYFNNIVQKMKYNRTFCENDAKKGMEIRHCAATHLGISGVKHVLLPYNSLTRR